MTTPARRSWTHALICLIACLAPVASAQRASDVAAIDPVWVAVTADDTPMRCGDLDRYYAIARFNAGDLLQIDGRSDGWVRVRYPAAVNPFVPAGDAKQAGADTIELTTASGLRAPSMLMGIGGSWKSVYDPPLPVGTRLRVVERETNAAGEVTGYRVEAPAPPAVRSFAQGFVRAEAVRNATAVEVERFLAAQRGDATPAAEPKPATQTPAIAAKPEPEPAATPESKPETKPQAKPDESLLEPMADATEPDKSQPETTPADTSASDAALDIVAAVPTDAQAPADAPTDAAVIEQGGDQGEAPDAATDTTPKPAPVDGLTPAELKDLEAAFENARKLPREELDVALGELLAEYKRAREDTDEAIVTRALDQRIDWLQLRIDTRDERRRLASTIATVDQRESELQQRVEQWKASRSFTIVGRLLPSRVYDGVRMPLMYRVESVEPLSYSRTIGYIRPDEGDQDLARYTGQVVGIRGLSSFDRELRMNIIEPREVEVLRNNG